MRILFFSDHFRPEPSAPAAHVYERSRLWAKEGHDVTVITSAPNFPEGRVFPGYRNSWRSIEWIEGVRVVRGKTYVAKNEGTFRRTLDYLSYIPSALLNAFREPRPDVVISTSPHLFCPTAGLVYTRLRGIPHVLEVRDLWPESLRGTTGMKEGLAFRGLLALERWLYSGSARIIAVTPGISSSIIGRGTDASKVALVLNGANLELFTPRPRDKQVELRYGLAGRFVVGYIGTVGLAHDLESAVRAFALLQHTRATLFIVGVGAAKGGLEALVKELGLKNVVFAPRVLKEDVPSHWSVCDLSLIHLRNAPVFQTAIPTKIFESMAMGLPILYAGPASPGAAIVVDRGAGVYCASGEPAVLARTVESLANDAPRLGAMKVASLSAAKDYSREAHARRTLEALAVALETGR